MTSHDSASDHTLRIRQAMDAAGYNQSELAERVGVSPSTVSMWLSGDRRPDRSILSKVADLLGVSAVWLDYGEGEGPRPDLLMERQKYGRDLRWTFRREQPDGSRDFGNANIFSFAPTIDTFVREVVQNSADATTGGPVQMSFSVRRLRGSDVDDFLNRLRWADFKEHLASSIESGQQVGSSLEAGLRAAESRELLLVEISDRGTTGLLGPEIGVGSFAALCRNNLDSKKASGSAGGSYGLGKAVLWRMSSLSTVLFMSNLVEPEPATGHASLRFIGRSELVWHQTADGDAFAGPGWFGAVDPTVADRPISYWESEVLARDLHMSRRADEPGTSILVVGFRDPSSDRDQSPNQIAEQIEDAVSRHFWPALTSESLVVTVEVAEGSSISRSVGVDIEESNPELAAMLKAHQNDEVAEVLLEPGDVVRVPVPLEVPACFVPGEEHPSFEHTAYVLVRRADPAVDSPSVGRAQFFRGTGMVVFETDLSRVMVGSQPFHCAVLCGRGAGDTAEDYRAERFLRTAEPPAHNTWEITEKLQREYERGSGAALNRFRDAVRGAVREVLIPAVENPPDGPRDLAALFKFGEPPKAQRAPRLIVDSAHVDDSGAWVVEATVRVPNPDQRIVGRPVLLFDNETGGGSRVSWRLEPIKDCSVEGSNLVVEPGRRTARFRAITDPTTHPVPSSRASVSVDFKAVRQETKA